MTASLTARGSAALRRTPWSGSYSAAVALALLGLCPFIVLSTAFLLLQQELISDLGTTRFGTQLAEGLSNGAYALGAVVAADLNRRIATRRLFITCELVFVVGSLLGALAPGIWTFGVGRVLQGGATGMLLVAALPPLVTNHGVHRLPTSAAVVNLGLFGMVTIGPVVGGLAAGFHAWRLLFYLVAVLGVVGAVVGVLAFGYADPPDRRMGFDWSGIPLAAAGTLLPFIGVSWLSRGGVTSPGFLVPLILGLAALGTLVVRQYRKPDALMPVTLIAHTLPVSGITGAMIAGAGFTTVLELVVVYLLELEHQPPVLIGALLATQVLGVAVAAWLFKVVLRTRWLPVLAFVGVGVVAIAGVTALALGPGVSFGVTAVTGLLLGFGAGAGVAPGLFMGGLSAPSSQLGPTFALVELLRAEAAFLVGPVLLHIAMTSATLAGGLRLADVIVVVLVGAVGVLVVALLLLGGARPHAPDLERWVAGQEPAYDSPPVLSRVRRSSGGGNGDPSG